MQLNIPNPKNVDLGNALGITDERQNELAAGMDKLVDKWTATENEVYATDGFNQIANLCTSTEELMWCAIVHMEYRRLKGWPYLSPVSKWIK